MTGFVRKSDKQLDEKREKFPTGKIALDV